MAYHITLSRPAPLSAITAEEWLEFVSSRPELKLADSESFITAILDGDENLTLHYSPGSGSVFTKNPEGPRIIAYMASIAPDLRGVVTGDEGESYTKESDWGTKADWEPRPKRRPWWRRELSPGKRIILGITIAIVYLVVKDLLASK